MVSQIIMYTT